jgi:NADH dehydrogenase FAD-containing subunit
MPNAKNITLDLSSLLPKFDINFINENAETIEPENNKVITENKKRNILQLFSNCNRS